MTEVLEKVGLKGTHLNLIKTTYENSRANIILNGEKLEAILLRNKKGLPTIPLLFNSPGSTS